MSESFNYLIKRKRKGLVSGRASQVGVTVFRAMVKDFDWMRGVYLDMAGKVLLHLFLGRSKRSAHFIRVIQVFIAPDTIYFSAASATAKNISGFIVITDGCRYWTFSEQGSMNWKRIWRTSDGSVSFTGLSSDDIKGGTANPAVATSRCFLWIRKSTLSEETNTVSAAGSLTNRWTTSDTVEDLH